LTGCLALAQANRPQEPAVSVKDLEAMIQPVNHEDIRHRVNKQPAHSVQLAITASHLAKRLHKLSVRLENLHPMIATVRHQDLFIEHIDRHVRRPHELRVLPALLAHYQLRLRLSCVVNGGQWRCSELLRTVHSLRRVGVVIEHDVEGHRGFGSPRTPHVK